MNTRHVVKPPPRLVYAAVVVAVSLLATAVASVVVSVRAEQFAREAVHESEQRLCRLIVIWDDRFRVDPPQDAAREQVAAEIAALREQYGCPTPPG